ncbi:hypothetical protein [Frigoriglobus tundricola]|uniref:Uncharacterized protein n=1 Tax=Frigoriglobus tundricola TaxID=2774151 RepID=A0A6M5YZQ0_9BACT|nr:hypothetical protein [Frigoriglobus tundricola]QJW98691.1 hypothetical protein FTUN_6286 [Frigoriglobus tundricola]
MSVLTTLVGGHYALTAGDKTYRVKSLIDQQMQADFARWHFERAVGELLAARALYSDAEFAAEREKLRADHRAGRYDFKSARGAELLGTPPGVAFILAQLVEGLDPAAAPELVAQCQEDVTVLLQQIVSDSFPEAIGLAKKKALLTEPVRTARPKPRKG